MAQWRNSWLRWPLLVVVSCLAAWLLGGMLVASRAQALWRARAIQAAGPWLTWAQRLRPWESQWIVLAARCAHVRNDAQSWQDLRDQAGNSPEWQLEMRLVAIESGAIQADPQQQLNELLTAGAETDRLVEAFVLGYLRQGDAALARSVLLTWNRDAPHFSYLQGRIADERQERSAAQAAYREALSRDPRHELARRALADALRQNQQFSEALPHYRYLIEAGGDARAWLGWADVARHLGDPDASLAALEEHVAHAADKTLAREYCRQRGHLALEDGDYQGASEWFQKGGPWPDDDTATWEAAATASALAGDRQRAREYFEHIDQLLREKKQARDQLAREALRKT
jgi:tetratricopeptide (TPR) repeat protein